MITVSKIPVMQCLYFRSLLVRNAAKYIQIFSQRNNISFPSFATRISDDFCFHARSKWILYSACSIQNQQMKGNPKNKTEQKTNMAVKELGLQVSSCRRGRACLMALFHHFFCKAEERVISFLLAQNK